MKKVLNALFIVVVLLPIFSYAQQNLVDRDSDGLIEINSLNDLNEIRNDTSGRTFRGSSEGCPSGWCQGFELTRDLDFDSNKNGYLDSGDWNSGLSWTSISATSYFRFDGNGHSISNVLMATPTIKAENNYFHYDYGFFSLASMADIHNVRFLSPKIIAEGSIMPTNARLGIGVVSGRLGSFSFIRKVSIENAVISFSRSTILPPLESFGTVGGFVGFGAGIFEYLHFDGSIQIVDSVSHIVGGIAGNINNSYMGVIDVQGTLHGSGGIGGIVGSAVGLNLWNSYSTADITSYGSWLNGGVVGGVISVDGFNPNVIADVYSLGNVQNGGGLIGYLNTNNSSIEMKSSYSKSVVTVNGQSYAQLIGSIQPTDLVLNLDTYQISDPNGVLLSAQAGSYTRPASSFSLQCATNPVSLNCSEPYLVSSWNPQYWSFGSDSQLPRLIQQQYFPWYSTDTAGGNGDYESIARLKEHVPEYSCDTPVDFLVKEKKTGYVFSAKTPEVFDFFNAKQGLKCSDAQQADGRCDNYEVTYLCGGADVIPQWTAWRSNDNLHNDGADNESIPASACSSGSPIGIRTRVVNSNMEYMGAPQIPNRFSLARGFNCLNEDNGRAGKINCKDYEVRMVCNVESRLSNF
jgi:hypothetical protein